MRTLGFRTHVLLTLAGAVGIVFALGRPWYGMAPGPAPEDTGSLGDINGPLNAFFDGAQRWLTDPAGSNAWAALDHWAVAIAAMAGVASLGALACLAAPLQQLGRDLLRYAALATFAIVAWKLLDPPGNNEATELRNGALVCAGFALVLVTCGSAVAGAPLRRKAPKRSYHAPPPPPAYGSSGPSGP
jgi:hypothetical protein